VKKPSAIAAAVLTVALILYSFHVHSHSQEQSRVSVDTAAEQIPNFDALVTELKQYHDCTCTCGCYAHDLETEADRAIAFLRERVQHRQPGEKLAIVLDIDETSLSNYQEMLSTKYVFDPTAFENWVNTSAAPAIPGTLRLDKEAQRLGVAIFFITGRYEPERPATERNLSAQGYEWKQLVLRPESTHSESTVQYKSGERAQIAAQGYRIILNVGDQWSDLKGSPQAEFSVKYPNPYYLIP
jgi:acid phosphatase